MKISIASGKGGTGKTLVATGLAMALEGREEVQLLDCDVEEPNAHIFLKPVFDRREDVTIPVPVIQDNCTHCGFCAEICAYHAIAVFGDHTMTFPELCHGCGACAALCPAGAIKEEGRKCGSIEWGTAGNIAFVRGTLNIGEAMATPVIRRVKSEAVPEKMVIIDAPPGTSCPVIETVKNTDFCVLVTEPTLFGLNDLKLAVETVRELSIPCGVVLNRAGSGEEGVRSYCESEHIPLLLSIPLDMEIARIYSRGENFVASRPEWQNRFREMFLTVTELIDEGNRCSQR